MNGLEDTDLFRDGLSLALKPLRGQLVLIEEVVRLVPHLGVVVIHPLDLGVAQQRRLDQVAADGSHGDMFKAQPLLVAKLVGCVDLARHDNVWDAC